MEVIAKNKSVQISPRKVQLVAEKIRNLPAQKALEVLMLIEKRAAYDLSKTLKSAISNALNNAKLSKESLFIKRIDVAVGPAMKRFHPSSRGRVHPYKKRTSHITIVLEEKK